MGPSIQWNYFQKQKERKWFICIIFMTVSPAVNSDKISTSSPLTTQLGKAMAKCKFWNMSWFSSVQSCLTLCDPMNRSTPGLPVHHQLLEFTQTHVHRVSDAIQPSHPLASPSPPAPSPSQHQSFPMSQFFAWGGQSTGVSALASFLPKKSQGWSPSEWTGWIRLQSKGLSRVFSNTIVQKHQFFGAQLSSQSNSHIHTWPMEKP